MDPLLIAAIVFACVFSSAMLGSVLRERIPGSHLDSESRDVMKLAIGLVATMAALVLGLLTASSKSSFDAIDSEIKETSAKVILLDRVLAHYGAETGEARTMMRQIIAARLAATWPDHAQAVQIELPKTVVNPEMLQQRIEGLAPQDDLHRSLQAKAAAILGDIVAARWLVFAQLGNTMPTPLLVVLVMWLVVLFLSFGLLSKRNVTVVITLAVCGLSVAGSILLILELGHPLSGFIRVSPAPLKYALEHLGQQ